MIQEAYQRLIDTYLASPHRKKVDVIEKAFRFACQAHSGVRRLSGEPYIMHPLAVAQIVCGEIGLGSTSICSALLHDVVEDTDYTVEDIQNIFGPKIAGIVDGVTKISGGIFGNQASAQAETFKKLLLTMSDDIRVILIKISDRLHNMRTLDSQLPAKQYKIAGETLYIYAPLANRLGLNKVKEELEDLSFRYEQPEQYALISNKLSEVSGHLQELFDEFTAPIRERLDQTGLKYEIKARIKSPYSIWNKMQNKKVTLDEIYDILAARIIFEGDGQSESEITDCWRIYAIATNIYRPHPERLRDWLSHPKANGYQALQTTLMSKSGRWIELQIRSRRMDDIAEQGFAAHWKYKDGETAEFTEDEGELNEWLHTIKEILDDPQPDAMDFLDAIKLNLFASEIFVFTPKGEIKTMPAGCTALDFAFSIHTFLGSHCIGAKVNHKLVPLSHKLQSGDQVEILTSKTQRVQPSWINFASTAKAKAKIQAVLRRDNREVQKLGEEMLAAFLAKNEVPNNNNVIDQLMQLHDVQKRDQLFLAIGQKTVILGEGDLSELKGKKKKKGGQGNSWRKFVPFLKASKAKAAETNDAKKTLFVVPEKFNKKKPIFITDENITQYKFVDCCHPIPGDDILGFIDNKNQIEIHKRSCPVADKLKSAYGNRILDAKWEMHKTLYFNAVIHMQGLDRIGLLNEVTKVISNQLNINIYKVMITCDNDIFDGRFELRVHDRDDLKVLIAELKKISNLHTVSQLV